MINQKYLQYIFNRLEIDKDDDVFGGYVYCFVDEDMEVKNEDVEFDGVDGCCVDQFV